MKSTGIRTVIATIMLIVGNQRGNAQGLFSNLDFEQSRLPLFLEPGIVPITNAMPGWTGYLGSNQIDQVWYNTVTLDAAAVTFQGPGSLFPAIQGNYSVLLRGSSSLTFDPQSAAIAQTGLIPLGSRSIVFLTGPTYRLEMSFAGQPIPLVQIGAGTNYIILGGDISQFARKIGELRITAPPT